MTEEYNFTTERLKHPAMPIICIATYGKQQMYWLITEDYELLAVKTTLRWLFDDTSTHQPTYLSELLYGLDELRGNIRWWDVAPLKNS